MMKCKKILSLFLAVLMLCSAMTGLSVMTVFADETTAGGTTTTPSEAPTVEETMKELYTEVFASPEEKLATMKPMYDNGKYTIYVQELSGEVAIKDLRTNQVLFTNPYDVGVSTASESVKNDILSQIIVKFEENGREKVFSSFEHAALRDQIKVISDINKQINAVNSEMRAIRRAEAEAKAAREAEKEARKAAKAAEKEAAEAAENAENAENEACDVESAVEGAESAGRTQGTGGVLTESGM